MEQRASAVIDLGGGDTSLGRVLEALPDLPALMDEAGVSPVAVYTVGPRVDDLASLATLEARNFRPSATAVVLNEGLAELSLDPETAFTRIRRHSAFRTAVERGTMPIALPRLYAPTAAEIEGRRLDFAHASTGTVPPGSSVRPPGALDACRVRLWLQAMDAAFVPLTRWLP